MLQLFSAIVGVLSCIFAAIPAFAQDEIIILGKWYKYELNNIILQASEIKDNSERIMFLSEKFLGSPYVGGTMVGEENKTEIFVINLSGLDCFTYLDYIEAMRRSDSFDTFKQNVKKVRYKGGVVDFLTRRHFFTDWILPGTIQDVTVHVGGDRVKKVDKELNQKGDGTFYLPGLPVVRRTVNYIPSSSIDENLIEGLQTGDYVGIYSSLPGLDVSHTGIIIKKAGRVYLRHASSKKQNMKVLDEDLLTYIADKPGLVVLRVEKSD